MSHEHAALEIASQAILETRAKIIAEFGDSNPEWNRFSDFVLRPAHLLILHALEYDQGTNDPEGQLPPRE